MCDVQSIPDFLKDKGFLSFYLKAWPWPNMEPIIKMSFKRNTKENLKNLSPENFVPRGCIWQLRAHTSQEKPQYRERKIFRATSLQHQHTLVIPMLATLSYTLSYVRSITSSWYAIKVSCKVKIERQNPSESWEWNPENWNTLWLSLQLLLNQLIAGTISMWWTMQRDGNGILCFDTWSFCSSLFIVL